MAPNATRHYHDWPINVSGNVACTVFVQLHLVCCHCQDRERMIVFHCVKKKSIKKNTPTTHPHSLSYFADKPFTLHLFMIIH